MKHGGIIILCGLASGYNTGEGYLPVKASFLLLVDLPLSS
jgi:hypothetical protein